MRVAVYDNLANNGVNHVRGLRRVGVDAHVVPDPRDEFAMSDPRWEEIDVELPSDRLVRSNLPPVSAAGMGAPARFASAGGTGGGPSRASTDPSSRWRVPHARPVAPV